MKRLWPPSIPVMIGSGTGILVGVFVLALEYGDIATADILLGLLAFLALPVGLVAFCLMIFKRTRRVAWGALQICVTLFVTCLAMGFAHIDVRVAVIGRIGRQLDPLVDAITKFAADEGRPPATLEELVPDYIAELPSTGSERFIEYRYEVLNQGGAQGFQWYDLGNRGQLGTRGLQVHTEGNFLHAILVVTIDEDGNIVGARTDRMPDIVEERPFDAKAWSEGEGRIAMVEDYFESHGPVTTIDQVKAALGDPDGVRQFDKPAWQLVVPCSLGLLNWDEFYYRPDEQYSWHGAGTFERVGRWGYLHE